MRLSKDSDYVPKIGECEKCPYVNKCNSGEKCFSTTKHRDRTGYYKQNRERILAQVKEAKI